MLTIKRTNQISLLLAGLLSTSICFAKALPHDVSNLGSTLAPLGATIEGNSEGSIPVWTGTVRSVPKGLKYKGSGHTYPDPYADDKLQFKITSKNYKEYLGRLSEGQKLLFATYPDTFEMPIYPSHRDFGYSELIEKRTRWNAENTKLVNGLDGLQNFTGGIPFPLPKSGGEVVWNARLSHPTPISDALYDEVAVYANGSSERRRLHSFFESPYAYTHRDVGTVDEDIGPIAGLIFTKVVSPVREKGKMAIVHEPLDYVRHTRNAWIYMPGLKRVRRAPFVGFDALSGPGGFQTIDETLGFNGSMVRYNWQLVDKKEMYIPYHAYRFDQPGLSYSDLLTSRHANSQYMRYELHRVWIVEATLKEGKSHIYEKRRFYIDEDSWQIVLTDNYDGRGELWRVGIINTLYDYYLQGYISRVQMNHDLRAKAYVATRLVNDTRPTRFNTKPKGKKYFTPQNLRRMGRR